MAGALQQRPRRAGPQQPTLHLGPAPGEQRQRLTRELAHGRPQGETRHQAREGARSKERLETVTARRGEAE